MSKKRTVVAVEDNSAPDDKKQLVLPVEITTALFTDEGLLATALEHVEKQVREFDAAALMSTPAGRKKIASFSYSIARSKTAIDNCGAELVQVMRQKVSSIDAVRKQTRDHLTGLTALVREPLTLWERAETERIDDHKKRIAELTAEAENALRRVEALDLQTLEDVKTYLDRLKERNWQEFSREASAALLVAELNVSAAISRKKDMLAAEEALRLAELRAAEIAQAEREERIRAEAQARAIRETEERMRAEAAAVRAAEEDRIRVETEARLRAEFEARMKRMADESVHIAFSAQPQPLPSKIFPPSPPAPPPPPMNVATDQPRVSESEQIRGDIARDLADKAGLAHDVAGRIAQLLTTGEIRHVRVIG